MDYRKFHLCRRPFPATPDTSLYFPCRSAELALTQLQHALNNHEGLALLDGEPGIGKTIVGLRFLERLPAELPRILIPAAKFSRPLELFQAMAFDCGAPYQGLSESELRLSIVDRLLAGLSSGQPTILVLDEAQHLSAEILEELRLLSNLESRSRKAILIVLLALPSLRQRLANPELQSFAQRLVVRARLERLDSEEARQFLAHQIQRSGGQFTRFFTEDAIGLLIEASQGIPRLLNQSAGLAMTFAAQAGEPQVDAEAVLEAVATLGLVVSGPVEESLPPTPSHRPQKPTRTAAKTKGQKRRTA